MIGSKRSDDVFKQMKIRLVLDGDVVLPIHFQSVIQGLLYSFFGDWKFIHNKGFKSSNGKVYKLFTFAIETELKKSNNKFYGQDGNVLTIVFSTPVNEIYNRLISGITSNKEFRLADNKIVGIDTSFSSVDVGTGVVVKTLSPITLGYVKNNKTNYISYKDKRFAELIQKNAKQKWESLHQQTCGYSLEVNPTAVRKKIAFLDFGYRYIVEGNDGIFKITSDNKDFLTFSLLSGLGYKNSQGFGCVEIVEVLA